MDEGSGDETVGVDAQAGAMAFSVLHEKALSQQVVLGCWCPTMDLLALVSDDGQLSVHRLEWQKLWVACPDAPITALCWRPDGKVLATGHRHGAVSLYDVEACELFRTLRAHHAAPICHLSWVQGVAPHPATATPSLHLAYRYRHTRFFPAPPPGREHGGGVAGGGGGGGKPPPAGAPAAGAAGPAGGGNGGNGAALPLYDWPPPPDSLDVLVTSDSSGAVSMSACGEVLVAALPSRGRAADAGGAPSAPVAGTSSSSPGDTAPPGSPRGEPPGALQTVLSRDLSTLLVLSHPAASGTAGDGTSPSPAAAAAAGAVGGAAAAAAVLSVYDCGKLGSCQAEILELSLLGGLVAGRMEVATAALGTAARAWRAAAAELSKRMDEQLREALESHGHDPEDIVGELTCCLASGHVSAPLQSFLTSTLTEPGLRRLAKTVDSALQQVSQQLLEGVLPALQLVAFVVGELRGRARAADITQTLGLQERAVALAEVEAAKALVGTESLRQLVTRVAAQYRVFFTWLLKTLQSLEEPRAEGDDPPVPGAASSGSLAGVPVCVPTLLDFLSEGGQFGSDAVARDLDASASTLGLPVGSSRFPEPLAQHLRALQEVAFPWPAEEDYEQRRRSKEEGTDAGGAAGAGGSGGSGSSWLDRPLQRQLAVLAELCRGAFGRLQRDVSPTLRLLARVPLLPPEAAAPQWGPRPGTPSPPAPPSPGAAMALQLPQLRTEPASGQPALLACVCATPPAAAAGCGGGGEVVLLMRLDAGPQRRSHLQACLLALPEGVRVLGLAFYRSAQLALLVGPPEAETDPRVISSGGGHQGAERRAGGGGGGAAAEAALVLVPTQDMPMCDLGGGGGEAGAGLTALGTGNVVQACAARGAVVRWPVPGCRLRRPAPGSGRWQAPLLVSGPRGLAAAFTDGSRALMLDLEEDEEGEEAEEGAGGEGEEEDEEEEDAGGGSNGAAGAHDMDQDGGD
ncbi:hypothetical protein GPECTOR_69g449 [Gonium pectorale]|uniref:Anaphase-promoting complex subunit 4 n=1 Tax=Gonium pectorale TaxID=33097 RepID=A0A150G3A6_GONPE|nr:hypothetical protein GPECTOR_69g449 [Gonium pectorale]|eukprot:KXZ44356.1 hypothetical protein GPECTOR_69g449 [Gonium pectorale]